MEKKIYNTFFSTMQTWPEFQGKVCPIYLEKDQSMKQNVCLSKGSPFYIVECHLSRAEDFLIQVWAKNQVIHFGLQTDLVE